MGCGDGTVASWAAAQALASGAARRSGSAELALAALWAALIKFMATSPLKQY